MFLNIKKITLPNANIFFRGLYDFRSSDVLCPVNICASSGKEITTFLIAGLWHSDCLYLAFLWNSEGFTVNSLSDVHTH